MVEEDNYLGPLSGTPHAVVEEALRFAAVTSADVLFDIGCNDGAGRARFAELPLSAPCRPRVRRRRAAHGRALRGRGAQRDSGSQGDKRRSFRRVCRARAPLAPLTRRSRRERPGHHRAR